MSNSVAVPEPTAGRDLTFADDADFAMMSYDELAAMANLRILGLTLVSKAELLGVPHIITSATYWMPKEGQKGMVSLEAVVGSPEVLRRAIERRWIANVNNADELRLEPNERIVYNDGGTGVRRQITTIGDKIGALTVGNFDLGEPDRFDTPWPAWDSFAEYRRQNQDILRVPTITRVPARDGVDAKPFRLMCERGLHVSQYDNQYADDAETYYLR